MAGVKRVGQVILLAVVMLACGGMAYAQSEQLKLSWQDNAANEDGTKIERGTASAGPFAEIFSLVGANLVVFTDNNLPQATTYCYRIRAFNAGGFSGYSNTACATTPAVLAVSLIGNGSGAVSSSPVGISCGTTCSVKLAGKSTVTLTAAAAAGSFFAGWGGACSGTGLTCTVTMDAAKSVTASFTAIAAPAAPSGLTATPVLP